MPELAPHRPTRARLVGPVRDQLEHGFAQRLGDVAIHVWPSAFPWPSARACAIGETVHVREAAYRPETPAGLALLAHEFAHVVQKRLVAPARCPEVGRVEAEAATAGRAVVQGQRYRCRVADVPGMPRFWGFAGHYYTVYFVTLAAGMDDLMAGRMAFYSQLPDLVKELAATSAGIDLFLTKAKAKVLDPLDHSHALARAERIERDYEVQEGLHALNGRSSSAETRIRTGRLRTLPFGSFAFGIALHPFGDSYAHRQIKHADLMYDPGIGHALDGHCPDHIQDRRELYLEYVETLYDLLVARMPHHERRLERIGLMARTLEITSIGGDSAQGAKMREIAARDMGRVMNPYRPDGQKAMSWKHFHEQYPELSGQMLDEAFGLAHQWARAG